MLRWIPYTFVRTVLFFIGGIVLGYSSPDLLPENLTLAAVVFLIITYILAVYLRRRHHLRYNPGWIGLSLVFILGYMHVLAQTESRDPDHLLQNTQEIEYYSAIVTRYAEEKARSWKVEARVDGIQTTAWEGRKGGIVLYLSKEDFPEPFEYGDILLVKGQPQLPEPAYNPEQFDYRKYLALRNIYHQHFVRGDDVVRIGHAPDNVFTAFAYRARRWAEEVLSQYVAGAREKAIASALVLGVTDNLDNELLDAYSATGTMHILAVSGLHISVIYFILLRILSPLNRFRAGRWAVAFVALGFLWLYAFVTGLSPSVLRAVMMFSFLAIARPWARSTNVYNTLAVSAFCLLLLDPFLVFSVGFQLSYLAVLGIVYIYPRLLRVWEPSHLITVEIWKITAVSLAAQLATFPLGLLYFHQFPNYFLISNLLVVPLSSGILILGLVLLTFSFVSPVATALGFCLEWVIRFVNGIVFMMEDLPFAVTENIYIDLWQSMLLMLLIVLVLLLFEVRTFRYITFCFVVVLIFSLLQWRHFFRDIDVRKLAVYRIAGHSAIDLIDHGQTVFVADDALKADARAIRYHIAPHRILAGVKSERALNVHEFQGGRVFAWGGGSVLQVTGQDYEIPHGIQVDWIVIGNNSIRNVEKFVTTLECRTVILDSSNSFFFAGRFLEEAKLHNLDVHSVLHQGAFVIEIENRDT